MEEISAPFVNSGDGDLGAAVVVVAVCLPIITLSIFLLRIYSTIRREKGFGWDDITLLLAVVSTLPDRAIDKLP